MSPVAAGRHSVGTIVGWIEVTREAEEAEEVTRGLELADEQLVIVGQEAANEMPTSRRVNFNIDLQPSSLLERPNEMYTAPIWTGVNKRFYNSCKTLLRGN